MTLIEKLKSLCDEHGETFASLERKMDFGNGTIRRWSNTLPSADKLAKVAEYFNVSVDYLLGLSENKNSAQHSELNSVYLSLAKDLQDAQIDPEDIKKLAKIIEKNMNKQ